MKNKNRLFNVYLIFFIAFFLQCFLSLSINNILSSTLVLISSLITINYLFGGQKAFITHPISSMALLGLNISTQSGAFLYQSFTLTPLEYNLYNPINTFLYIGLYQLSLILSHFIYRKSLLFTNFRRFISSKVLNPLGVFKQLPIGQLWVIGGIGLFSTWFSVSSSVEYGDTGGKFLSAFIPFCYAPILIPFFVKDSFKNGLKDKNNRYLTLYILLLIIAGIIKNSRGTFAEAFITFFIIYFMFLYLKKIIITHKQIKKIALWVLPAILGLSILSDISTAMTAVRSSRADISGIELGVMTLSTVIDRGKLEAYKESLLYKINNNYNEDYISNPIFARLITTKFNDNMLAHSELLNETDYLDVINISGQKIIAQLPTPMINLLSLGVNKTDLEFSMEDYIWFLISGKGLGGYRVGSITAHGLIMFSGWFYLISIIFFPILYSIIDSFSFKKDKSFIFSPLVLIFIYKFYSLFYSGSLVKMLSFFIRGLPQMIFLYLIIILTLKLFSPYNSKKMH